MSEKGAHNLKAIIEEDMSEHSGTPSLSKDGVAPYSTGMYTRDVVMVQVIRRETRTKEYFNDGQLVFTSKPTVTEDKQGNNETTYSLAHFISAAQFQTAKVGHDVVSKVSDDGNKTDLVSLSRRKCWCGNCQPAAAAKPSPISGHSSPTITPQKKVPKPKPPPVTAFNYSSDEEIPITKVPLKKKPAPAPLTIEREIPNSSTARDSSPEIPVTKSLRVLRPRPKSPISSSSSSEDEAEDTDEPMYVVRSVLDVRGTAPDREFLIHWEGYDSDDDSWEPEERVSHLQILHKWLADRRERERIYEFSEEVVPRRVVWRNQLEDVFVIPSRKYRDVYLYDR